MITMSTASLGCPVLVAAWSAADATAAGDDISLTRTVRLPDGAARLVGKLTNTSPLVRAAAARRLTSSYQNDARPRRTGC